MQHCLVLRINSRTGSQSPFWWREWPLTLELTLLEAPPWSSTLPQACVEPHQHKPALTNTSPSLTHTPYMNMPAFSHICTLTHASHIHPSHLPFPSQTSPSPCTSFRANSWFWAPQVWGMTQGHLTSYKPFVCQSQGRYPLQNPVAGATVSCFPCPCSPHRGPYQVAVPSVRKGSGTWVTPPF